MSNSKKNKLEKDSKDNRANQMNPQHPDYYKARIEGITHEQAVEMARKRIEEDNKKKKNTSKK